MSETVLDVKLNLNPGVEKHKNIVGRIAILKPRLNENTKEEHFYIHTITQKVFCIYQMMKSKYPKNI
jgi:hypothetical protein